MAEYSSLWDTIVSEVLPIVQDYRSRVRSLGVSTKDDGTLLTEADIHVQGIVLRLLRDFDSRARVIAEEDRADQGSRLARPSDRTWIVDPIDGTTQFIHGSAREFCIVVAAYRDGYPDGCLILAPELSRTAGPLTIRLDGPEVRPTINSAIHAAVNDGHARQASATRSGGSTARPYEAVMTRGGLTLKTRTTSQTLDMARTCLDLEDHTGLESFAWFFRPRQKLWDGAAGIALAYSCGMAAIDLDARPIVPLEPAFLENREPMLRSTVVAPATSAAHLARQLAAGMGSA